MRHGSCWPPSSPSLRDGAWTFHWYPVRRAAPNFTSPPHRRDSSCSVRAWPDGGPDQAPSRALAATVCISIIDLLPFEYRAYSTPRLLRRCSDVSSLAPRALHFGSTASRHPSTTPPRFHLHRAPLGVPHTPQAFHFDARVVGVPTTGFRGFAATHTSSSAPTSLWTSGVPL